MITDEGPTTLYLKTITRILCSILTVVDCSDNMPVKFSLDNLVSLCQTKQGTVLCNSLAILDPTRGLEGNLETLDSSQSLSGTTSLLTDIQSIVMNFLVRSNFHTSLEAAITFNAQLCKDSLYCNAEFYQPMTYRRKLFR